MKTNKNFTKQVAASMLITTGLSCGSLFAAELDILFVYDDYTKSRFSNSPETALQNWVDQTNNFYTASKVDLSLRIVDTVNYNVTGSSMNDVLENARTDSWINEKREAVGADFVSVVHETGNCGIAYMAIHSAWAYSVVGSDCGNANVLAHELGHNMGLNHSRAQGDTEGARYKYALGHGVSNSFGTLMTYYWTYNGKSATVFSNPDIDCYGNSCGVEEGEADQADAAKALNNIKNELAAFQPTKVSDDSDEDSSSDDSSDINQGRNVALTASVSTSYVSDWETLSAVNDGKTPQNSNDKTDGAYGNWYSPDTIQWVRYDWSTAVALHSSDVYWFDDNGGVLVPTVAYLEYWNGSSWVNAGDVPLVEDAFNTTSLKGITTTSLRISLINDQQSTGILEWRVFASE